LPQGGAQRALVDLPPRRAGRGRRIDRDGGGYQGELGPEAREEVTGRTAPRERAERTRGQWLEVRSARSRGAVRRHGGSPPPLLHGLHRQIRHVPFAQPTTGPYFLTAPMKYSLHPGSNRHIGGNSGRISLW